LRRARNRENRIERENERRRANANELGDACKTTLSSDSVLNASLLFLMLLYVEAKRKRFFLNFSEFKEFYPDLGRINRILPPSRRFAEQKPKEKGGAEEARNDADRQNAREKNDSRERMTTGEEERAEEERRRD